MACLIGVLLFAMGLFCIWIGNRMDDPNIDSLAAVFVMGGALLMVVGTILVGHGVLHA